MSIQVVFCISPAEVDIKLKKINNESLMSWAMVNQ